MIVAILIVPRFLRPPAHFVWNSVVKVLQKSSSMCELAELEYIAWTTDEETNHIDKIADYLRNTEDAESLTDCRPFSGRVRRAWANLLFDRGLKAPECLDVM